MTGFIHLGSHSHALLRSGLSLDGLHNFAVRFARDQFLQAGEFPPLWFLAMPSRIDVIATPWQNDDDKQRAIASIRAALRAFGITVYSQISEVWMSLYSNAELENLNRGKGPPPSERANRQEALMITTFTTEDFRLARLLILSHEPPRLGELEDESADRFQGRMWNLLRPERMN